MSFGFDQPIPVISQALDAANQRKRPPLIFAATSNDGAHKPMAWPAREPWVFGISSTDAHGASSPFNPDENDTPSTFYAFGDGFQIEKWQPKDKWEVELDLVSGTSVATPVAAGFAANLLHVVQAAVDVLDKPSEYDDLPERLRRGNGMLKVMLHCMRKTHQTGLKSLLPWDLFTKSRIDDGSLLEIVKNTLNSL